MKKLTKCYIYFLISAFSILFFIFLYGFSVLNPTNVDWLLTGGLDISQHYSGWLFFRKEPWLFPVGNFTGLSYPNEMSIIYMDSIPLLAVIFKIFQPVLPSKFQYFGLYELGCFILQGVLGVKIVRKYCKNDLLAFLSGSFILMTPIFLWRVFLHVALSSQWILLFAFMSIFCYDEYADWGGRRLKYYIGEF